MLNSARLLLAITLIIFTGLIAAQVLAQTSFMVTVTTDKQQYSPGEIVSISGKVLDSQGNPVAGAAVSIEVNQPPLYVQLVSSDQSGSYTNQFVLSNTFAPSQYTIFVTAHKGNFTATQQAQFTVLQQTTSSMSSSSSSAYQSSTSPSTTPSQCFIATATYGSDMAPEVALLRNFRDTKILQTSAGKSFMMAFNAFYYSFSPQVASYIAPNPVFRDSMKTLLYPLIGILYASERIFVAVSFNREVAVTVAGMFAAAGIGFVYVGPVLTSIRCITKSGKTRTTSFVRLWIFCGAASLGMALGEMLSFSPLVTVGAIGTVLGFVGVGGLSAAYLGQMVNRSRKNL